MPKVTSWPASAGGAAGFDGGAKTGSVADHVVGGEHEQQGVSPKAVGMEGRHRDRRSRVAADRLQQDSRRFHTDLAHLLGHDEAVALVADQQRRRQIAEALQPLLRLLQQRVLAFTGQGPILLGVAGPRQGPQAGAGAAAEDDWHQGGAGLTAKAKQRMMNALKAPTDRNRGAPGYV